MPKKEANFDLFIRDLLQNAGIAPTAQGSANVEIDRALKTASKNQTGAVGFPEYVALVDDFVLVVEDKADRAKLVLKDDDESISQSVDATRDYAVNGALYYARKIAENSSFEKIFAFGCAGDAKKHDIRPIFVDKGGNYRELSPIETFENFSPENVARYYRRYVLNEEDAEQIELRDAIKKAQELHEYLRNYGGLTESEKPLVVAAALLALREEGKENFIQSLSGDSVEIDCDGKKIFDRVSNCLKRAKVSPETKLERVLSQFAFIKVRPKLNEINPTLGKTPLRFFVEFVDRNLFKTAVANHSEDLLGRYYDAFVSYTGGDGQSLGVVLTPSHITDLFCELVDLKPDDVVLDPCCGTGGFLVAAMNKMLENAQTDAQRKHIRQKQLYGFEILENMFSIATTNMILRGDGRSNLVCDDFFKQNPSDLQLNGITVGLMNPPYSQAKNKETANLSELNFIERLLDSVTQDGRVAVIVPISTMIGKTKEDKLIKRDILKKHTLEGVISLNKNTFYQIGTVPCIAVFTTGNKHPKDKLCKFINFEDDGFEVKKHVGLVETERAKDRRRYLLDCWRGKNAEYPTQFMIETTVDPDDEWIYSFYYFNDELPTDADFEKAIADYLSFEFSMIAQNKGYLFDGDK